MRTPAVLLAVICLTAVAAFQVGCGGDKMSGPSAVSPPSSTPAFVGSTAYRQFAEAR